MTNTSAFLCTVLPYFDTTYCDNSVSSSPVTCSACNVGMVVVLFLTLLLLSIFIVVGNIAIITVISKNAIFHNPFNMFKCSLAVADLLVGIIVIPSALVQMILILFVPYSQEEGDSVSHAANNTSLMTRDELLLLSDNVCRRIHRENSKPHGMFLSIISVLSIMASILNLVLLSVDRFMAVFAPIKYNQGRAINNTTAGVLILVLWVICIILSAVVPTTMGTTYFKFGITSVMIFTLQVEDSSAGFFYTLFAFGLPYILLLSLNLGTAIMLFRKWSKIKKKTGEKRIKRAKNKLNTRGSSGANRNEIKATVTLLVMVLVFTISTVPSLIVLMLFYEQDTTGDFKEGFTEQVIYVILILLLVSNSAWNFIIYSWRNDNFRQALKKYFCGKRKRQGGLTWNKLKSIATREDVRKKKRRQMLARAQIAAAKSEEERRVRVATVIGAGKPVVRKNRVDIGGCEAFPPQKGENMAAELPNISRREEMSDSPPRSISGTRSVSVGMTRSASIESEPASRTTCRTASTLLSTPNSPSETNQDYGDPFFIPPEEVEGDGEISAEYHEEEDTSSRNLDAGVVMEVDAI